MLTGVELMQWIEQFGRWNVQEFVAGSQDMMDVLIYLRAERILEMNKLRSGFADRPPSSLSWKLPGSRDGAPAGPALRRCGLRSRSCRKKPAFAKSRSPERCRVLVFGLWL